MVAVVLSVTQNCEQFLYMHCVLQYVYKMVTDGFKITHMSAGFDSHAVLVDENSPFVLKYRTPKFR